eukprot:scaffold28228_cov42-Phaeocystis_antarctica.AAC.2
MPATYATSAPARPSSALLPLPIQSNSTLPPAAANGFVPAWPFAVPPQPAYPEPARLPTGKSVARLALEASETPPLSINASAEIYGAVAPDFEFNAPLPEREEKG